MQGRKRFLMMIWVLLIVLITLIWAAFAPQMTAIYFFAIAFIGIALVLAFLGFLQDEPRERVPQGLINRVSRENVLEKFSKSLSVPFMILSSSGRVIFISETLEKNFPYVKTGQHYSNLARSSSFVDGVKSALQGNVVEPFYFETHRLADRVHLASLSQINGEDLGVKEGEVLVEIHDRTDEQKSDIMRRDFIANASHELRTPLASILGALETIKVNDDLKTMRHFLPIMRKEAKRMQRLIEDLMALSRIEMNEHYPPEEEVDLAMVLDHSLEALTPQIEKYNAKIENNLQTPIFLHGDADQLQQIISNIIENAILYSGKKPKIEIELTEDETRFPGKIGLQIRDHGPGIDAQHLNRLTERFYRVSKTQSKAKGGTGLGLAIVKHMVLRHQGELTIQSTLGEGSIFTIWLPHL